MYKQELLAQSARQGAGTSATPIGGATGTAANGVGAAAGRDGGASSGAAPPPVAFDPDTCADGNCWWSKNAADDCRSAGVPLPTERPDGNDGPQHVADIYLGLTQVRLGTTGVDGQPKDNAWEDFGFDLDAQCTSSASCAASTGASCRSPGPAMPYDGQLCRDNSFARMQPVLAKLPEFGDKFGLSEEAFNCQLWRGGYNIIVRLSGYNGDLNDPSVRVDYYLSTGIEESISWKCPMKDFRTAYPRWRAARTWGVSEASLDGAITEAGKLPNAKANDPNAYVKYGYLVAQVPNDTEQGFIGDNDPYRGFMFKAQQGAFVGRLRKGQDGTWSVTDGLLGGRIRKADLVQAFRETGFCESGDLNTFYQILLDLVDETSDVLADGSSDPSKDCDAMSYGIAFEASQLSPGAAVKVPARVQCCAPGKSAEACVSSCGDGIVNGDEKCDIGIAAGMPGACPTTCPTNGCTGGVPIGSGCATVCVPQAITTVGPLDGCCPNGATFTNDRDCVAECGNNLVEPGETCDPPTTCKACGSSTNACFTVHTTGSAATCDVRCELEPVKDCRDGDGCCPKDCTSTNDRDCSATCKNGTLEPGETCDNGSSKPCPADCNDGKKCTTDQQSGSADNCALMCMHTPITQALSNDGCCPDGVSANADNDCETKCGNGFVEQGEQCDDANDVAGDGCFGCKNEDQGTVCMTEVGKDACAQCMCTRCTMQSLACYGSDPESKLCSNLVECQREKHCSNPDCFCGTASLLGCLAGTGNGACKKETTDAAKTEAVVELESRSTDLAYPLGRANALYTCMQRSCATECMIK